MTNVEFVALSDTLLVVEGWNPTDAELHALFWMTAADSAVPLSPPFARYCAPVRRGSRMPSIAAPKPGDPCPQCGGAFVAARQLTDDERRRFTDRENPEAFTGFVDTAPGHVVAKLGPLAQCASCGYQTRYVPPADEGDEKPARSRGRARQAPAAADADTATE